MGGGEARLLGVLRVSSPAAISTKYSPHVTHPYTTFEFVTKRNPRIKTPVRHLRAVAYLKQNHDVCSRTRAIRNARSREARRDAVATCSTASSGNTAPPTPCSTTHASLRVGEYSKHVRIPIQWLFPFSMMKWTRWKESGPKAEIITRRPQRTGDGSFWRNAIEVGTFVKAGRGYALFVSRAALTLAQILASYKHIWPLLCT